MSRINYDSAKKAFYTCGCNGASVDKVDVKPNWRSVVFKTNLPTTVRDNPSGLEYQTKSGAVAIDVLDVDVQSLVDRQLAIQILVFNGGEEGYFSQRVKQNW